ncbi:hypothetical protein ElyMa_006476100 [Elysia marginata]|uniref:Uncharacterized protein n=1 Tax=Elysia marginata TaxID=1093978 RepID=A0AAV4I2E5_9GAST|nr:hypothetical protein ElyMa_006476100 [Elysia marginata]
MSANSLRLDRYKNLMLSVQLTCAEPARRNPTHHDHHQDLHLNTQKRRGRTSPPTKVPQWCRCFDSEGHGKIPETKALRSRCDLYHRIY